MGHSLSRETRSVLKIDRTRRITAGLTDHEHPAISPDGSLIAFYAGIYGSIQVYLASRTGSFARLISPVGGNNTQPTWHPGGTKVACRHQDQPGSKWEIWETAITGEAAPAMLLGDERWNYKHPSYDPTGGQLAYFSDEGSPDKYNLWLLDLGSGVRTQLTNDPERNDCHPVFSPDGSRIVFHAYEQIGRSLAPPTTNLYQYDIASEVTARLTDLEDQIKHPFYLSNKQVTFHHEDNSTGIRKIGVLSLKDNSRSYLTDGSNNDKHPFPWHGKGKKRYIAWSSKKLGTELTDEEDTYDIFVGRLVDVDKKKYSASAKKEKAAQLASRLIKNSKGKFKKPKDCCTDCAVELVKNGVITRWDQAADYKVKGKKKACSNCPARIVLDS